MHFLPPEVARLLEFQVADALQPALLQRKFGSVVDSGFLHPLEADQRDRFCVERLPSPHAWPSQGARLPLSIRLHGLGQQFVKQGLTDTQRLFYQRATFQDRLAIFVDWLFASIEQAQRDALAPLKGFA